MLRIGDATLRENGIPCATRRWCSLGVVTAKVVGRPALHLASPPSEEGREPAYRGGIFDLEFEI